MVGRSPDARNERSEPIEFTPELLEKMRAIGLRLDRGGTFWHEGTAVTHPRLRQALLRWLDVRDDGRDIIRLDPKRYAYVDVEDAHLRARSAHWSGDRIVVLWDDDREDELDYGSLCQAPDNALYATVRGKLRGRIAGIAYHAIAERIAEAGAGFALEAAGRAWPIPQSSASGDGVSARTPR
ncbi:MAG: hypothetical protein KF773_08520 [Deltaproteobacteria bacterium]|nr:hypothetical protein [Deltaproteobacteria bacterium]MCW5807909.1 hypothetical protein [Deltaproteobacteria bacterium]